VSRLIIGYVAPIVVWFGLWLIVRDGWWWLALLNRIVPYLFAPAPLIVLIALAARKPGWIAASLVPPIIFLGLFGPYLVPQPIRPVDGARLSVMTFNVLYSNTDYDGVARAILAHQPDLVALQEVQPEMMTALTGRLDAEYPYALMGDAHPFGTTAAFSRHPIRDARILDLQADRPAVVLEVEIEGRAVTFISAHLLAYGLEWIPWNEFAPTVTQRIFEQERQARLLVEEVKRHTGPVILACDCNSKETSGSYRILAEAMTNAAREVGWVNARPSIPDSRRDTDIQHIDYVFLHGPLDAVEVLTLDDTADSDHLPVLATLRFTD
jgi:vancomycin resistance protein VanJ